MASDESVSGLWRITNYEPPLAVLSIPGDLELVVSGMGKCA